MVWVIAFGELFFGDLWCVVWGYGGMRTHFSLLNPFLCLTALLRTSRRPHKAQLDCAAATQETRIDKVHGADPKT